jgi:hypothetical protein
MLETLRVYIKVVVDIERGLLCRRRRKTRGRAKLSYWKTVVDSVRFGVPLASLKFKIKNAKFKII